MQPGPDDPNLIPPDARRVDDTRFEHMTLKDLLRAMNLEGVDLTHDQAPTRDIEL